MISKITKFQKVNKLHGVVALVPSQYSRDLVVAVCERYLLLAQHIHPYDVLEVSGRAVPHRGNGDVAAAVRGEQRIVGRCVDPSTLFGNYSLDFLLK